MRRLYEVLKGGMEPLTLSALYVVINLNLYFRGSLPLKYYFMLILLLLILNIWTLSFVLSFIFRRLSSPYDYFFAYLVWLASYLIVFGALKKVILSYDYLLLFLAMLVAGLLIVVFYVVFSRIKTDFIIITAGAFASYLYLMSLDYFAFFVILLIFLIFTGLYSGILYKLKKLELKTIGVSFIAGALLYSVAYFVSDIVLRLLIQ